MFQISSLHAALRAQNLNIQVRNSNNNKDLIILLDKMIFLNSDVWHLDADCGRFAIATRTEMGILESILPPEDADRFHFASSSAKLSPNCFRDWDTLLFWYLDSFGRCLRKTFNFITLWLMKIQSRCQQKIYNASVYVTDC